ncbi:MAG: choice-of-anchor U domain-containing protein [Janthinobacterium lividum]
MQPLASPGTPQPIETGNQVNSLVWDSVMLGDGSAIVVLVTDEVSATTHLTIIEKGGATRDVPLNMSFNPGDVGFSMVAVGADRFAVVTDDGNDAYTSNASLYFQAPFMQLFDRNGTEVGNEIALPSPGLQTRYFDTLSLADDTFLVRWFNDNDQKHYYTRYDGNGVPVNGQNAVALPTPTNDISPSFAADGSGGFLYAAMTTTNSYGGVTLQYVSADGAVRQVGTVAAGTAGAMVFDGADFRIFHYAPGPDAGQVYMSKVSLNGTVSAPAPAGNLTAEFAISAIAMEDGTFIVSGQPAFGSAFSRYVWIDDSGAILSDYTSSNADAYPLVVAAPDGAVVIDNYSVGGQYDSSIAGWNSAFLDPAPSNAAPVVATPTSIGLADTPAADTFTVVKGTLSATDDVAVKRYGIEGGVPSEQLIIDGQSGYNIQKKGSYGTLYLRSSDGQYAYKPDAAAINALAGAASEQFTLGAFDDADVKGTAVLTINLSGSNDTPVVLNMDGYAGVFVAGSADPVGEEAYIGPADAGFIDGDFHNGYLLITQTSGNRDGYFVGDAARPLIAGPDAQSTDGRFDAGDKVFADLWDLGFREGLVEIGTVSFPAGAALRIDFHANATARHVGWVLQNLTYTAPTPGERAFTLVVDDGRGLKTDPVGFTMSGTDEDPPLIDVYNPGQGAISVAAGVSPQIGFNEDVKFGSGKIVLVDTASGNVVEEFDVATDQGSADGQLSISGKVLTINPSGTLNHSTSYAIRIEAGALTDLVDNAFGGVDGSAYSFTTSAPPPTVAISADDSVLKAGQSTTVRFVFSSKPVNFEHADVQVSGGTLGALSVDPDDDTMYTAQFSPAADAQSLQAVLSISAGAFQNASNGDNLASNVLRFEGDTLLPRIASIVRVTPTVNGAVTNADTLVYRVDFNEAVNVAATDFSVNGSTATVTGVQADSGNSHLVTVSGGDLAGLNGTVTLGLAAGHTIHDSVGNLLQSRAPLGANETAYVLDNAVAAPTLALASDTGANGGDGITRAPAIAVGLASEATRWEYSVDGGANWTPGTGNSFNLPEGSHVAGEVQVRQQDAAGNVSAAAANAAAITVDNGAPTIAAVERATLRQPSGTDSFTVKVSYSDANGGGLDAASVGTGDISVTADADGAALDVLAATLDAASGIATYTIAAPAGGWSASHPGTWSISLAGSQLRDLAGNAVTPPASGTSFEVTFNGAPVITSNGGGADATIRLAENTAAVTTVAANDDGNGALVYSIDGGADADLFTIDAGTGQLRFGSAPRHDTPRDSDADNTYEVRVKADDGEGGIDLQTLRVQVLSDIDGDGSADVDDSDIDGDGRANTVEDAVPGAQGVAGDGNGDGIADSSQINVASLPTVVEGAPYVTLAVAPGMTLMPVTSGPAPGGLPRNVKMPLGQLDFTIGKVAPGATVEMSIYVDAALKVNSYFKQDNKGKWANLAKSIETVGSKTKITFELTDGGIYDSDGLVNGSISDPGGVAWTTPTITSDSGEPQASVSVREGSAAVTTVVASAAGAVSYAISGGMDAALFRIDAQTGVLHFVDAPDFERPRDQGDTAGNNSYVVEVRASDASGSSSQLLTVRVTDVDEAPAPTPPSPPPLTPSTVDGVQVQTGTVTNADGSTSHTIIVPVVTPTRQEQVGNNTVADIPLAGSSASPLLSAQVPTGYGLQATGTLAPKPAGASLADLIREIKAHTEAGSHDQTSMVGGGTGFLSGLALDTPLLVQTVVPTVAAGGTPAGGAIVISGTPRAADAPMSALVIDSRALPGGSEIQLHNVEFAAIVGAARVTGGAGSQIVWGDSASQTIILGADDDVMHGGAGDDIVGSAGGNDRIYGDEGNDLVFGGEGDDYVDGGSGLDTVLLAGGKRTDYSIRIDGGNVVMTHLNGGADGRDTLANIETLRFGGADGAVDVAVGSTDLGTLVHLYTGMFGRDADQDGINFWLGLSEAGQSLRTIASWFVISEEAQQRYGALSNEAFVDMLYRVGLGRDAEDEGFAFWTARLDEGVTRGDVLLSFAESAEMAGLVGVVSTTIGLAP